MALNANKGPSESFLITLPGILFSAFISNIAIYGIALTTTLLGVTYNDYNFS